MNQGQAISDYYFFFSEQGVLFGKKGKLCQRQESMGN